MSDITGKFKVLSETGGTYEALTLQDRIDTTGLTGRRQTFAYGLRKFRLADGRTMSMLDETTFQIVETGERVKRVE
jgi:hypothetical protein